MHRMRCSQGQLGCGRRFTKKLAPHKYAHSVRCPNCKSIHVHSVNRAALAQTKRRKARGLICHCRSYPFPHVKGSMRFCVEHPKYMRQPAKREWRAYESCVATPRGQCA
jgi:hypothetical protein